LSEERLVLGAELKDGMRIRGQFNISHPHPKKMPFATTQQKSTQQSPTPSKTKSQRERSGSASSISRHQQVVKSSLDSEEAISSLHSSPISKIAYLLHDLTWRRRNQKQSAKISAATAATQHQNQQWSDRHELSPEPNPLVLDAISNANCIVYGCGSLFTSVLPSLILDGEGEAIFSRRSVPKVLLLNGWHDSETSWAEQRQPGDEERVVKRMDATSFVRAVVEALDQDVGLGQEEEAASSGDDSTNRSSQRIPLVTDYITHILYPLGTEIEIDEQSLANLCNSRAATQQQNTAIIHTMGIESIPANTCSEGRGANPTVEYLILGPWLMPCWTWPATERNSKIQMW